MQTSFLDFSKGCFYLCLATAVILVSITWSMLFRDMGAMIRVNTARLTSQHSAILDYNEAIVKQ